MIPSDSVNEAPRAGGSAQGDKILLVLSYLGIFSLIPLLAAGSSENVRWHARQGTLFNYGVLLAALVLVLFGFGLNMVVALALVMMALLVDVVAMGRALNGQRWPIPIVGTLGDRR